MKCVLKKIGKSPEFVVTDGSLKSLQKMVGGYIESVYLGSGIYILCNEDGRLIGLKDNCRFCNINFCGDVVLVGAKNGEFTDFPLSEDVFRKRFAYLYEEE